jgi:serine protease Do
MIPHAKWRLIQALAVLVMGIMVLPSRSGTPDGDNSLWPTDSTDFPTDVAQLRALQSRVQQVVEKCTPSTVGILIGIGAGSGVIVSEDGLVLTAAHVIAGDSPFSKGAEYKAGRSCKIVLADGRKVNGKTLGINPKTDAGMVQITDPGPNGGKWPAVPLGKSGELKRGQWVVTLGHPGGPKQDRPPVARLGRVENVISELIRTNCALVGGDSGGPLFDLDGRLVGIHSRIGLTLNQNIHVPIEKFQMDWKAMLAGEVVGRPSRPSQPAQGAPFLGVVFPDDEEDDAWITEEVEPSTPAGQAGLRAGDTITKFNGQPIKSVKQFREMMAKHKPGDEIKLTIRRGTTIMTLSVKLGRRPSGS